MKRNTILVVTGTRAEYGLLVPVMKALRSRGDADLKILATGAHLLPAHGMTVDELVRDGFAPDRSVAMVVAGDSREAMGKSIGLGVIGYVDAFAGLAPDCVVILGDRYEMLAAATAALALGIPIAHVEGGHVTEGAVDDSIRHAVTKMAHLHFTAAEPYAARVRQMGEPPELVHVVGATGLDNVVNGPRIGRTELEVSLGAELGSPLLLVTHHPATADASADPRAEIREVLEGLRSVRGATIVFTLANPDPGGEAINRMVREFVAEDARRRIAAGSLGLLRYLSLAAISDAVVGNSSSGLIEIPSVGVPTVNIGDRQKGRLRAASVIDVPAESAAVADALAVALSPGFRAVAARRENPMGDGRAGERIAAVLATTDFRALGPKRFHDIASA